MKSHYDVAIIGAGPAGLSAAYELTKSNKKVVVLERSPSVGGLAKTIEIMKIKIEAFAILKDLFGQGFLEYELPEGTTAEKMLDMLSRTFPNSEQILNVTRVAHQDEYLSQSEVLMEGESYALIPPVSGGLK